MTEVYNKDEAKTFFLKNHKDKCCCCYKTIKLIVECYPSAKAFFEICEKDNKDNDE